jgi:two-component sensor histidine kinase/PAS domain-containing protein
MSDEKIDDGDAADRPAVSFESVGLAGAIIQTMDQPLLILSMDLTVKDANPAFCELFKVGLEETRGHHLYELGNRLWDTPELRRLLEEVLPARSVVKHYRVEHKFPDIGKRVMILNASRLPPDTGRPELILLVISDRTEAEQARFELEGHREFQEKLIDSVREALLVLDWDLRVVQANQPFYDTFEVSPSETEGRLVYELGNRQWDIPQLRDLLENVLPDDNAFDDVEVDHVFEGIGRRIMLLNGRRLDHLDLILLAIRDITEQRRMEAQQQTLMGELDHRVRNALTTVSALARRALRESHSLEEFRETFEGRLDALARTQDFLTRAPQAAVGIAEILRLELGAQGAQEGRNFNLHGPEISLPPRAVQAFAMVIHELTTNAVKHGALASPEGQVAVSWEMDPVGGAANRVVFRWREYCPNVDINPTREGYGSRVLENILRHSLGGTSRFTLNPDGAELVAEFQF